ncbi:related to OPY2 protein [Phialocephala subalpina]|uniref:Related to OPY2 protein n=1 Tax=Phialocephala subalpina TaxID=576137 RepID=A0A1L7X442_9HELO|nr:related to OPY2 protein [Phialocephala subalpina]
MAYYAGVPFESLFRRCVTGCGDASPTCPTCPSNQICSLVPPTCDQCQHTVCVESSAAPSTISSSSTSKSSGPNVGAIAGGVIGGVAVIAAVTYLVWRFCIKTKRQQYEQENWAEDPEETEAAEKDFTMRRDARASTHTVGSIASTVLTRASNIIQIAYIPGVTNRSAPSTPGLLVPPVPPIPIALSGASTPRYEQEHFFMPGDLRDSTYSGISDRTSYARTSVASTIYGKNAIVSPVPAQTVIRGKPALVSVKSNGNSSTGDLTPPVPSVDYSRYGPQGPPSPAFSVGSTFLNNASTATATTIRPQVIRVVSAPKKVSPTNSIAEEGRSPLRSPLGRDSNAITIIDDTPSLEQGPFSDNPAHRPNSNSTLSAVIEEAQAKKAKRESRQSPGTPFGDENEVKE